MGRGLCKDAESEGLWFQSGLLLWAHAIRNALQSCTERSIAAAAAATVVAWPPPAPCPVTQDYRAGWERVCHGVFCWVCELDFLLCLWVLTPGCRHGSHQADYKKHGGDVALFLNPFALSPHMCWHFRERKKPQTQFILWIRIIIHQAVLTWWHVLAKIPQELNIKALFIHQKQPLSERLVSVPVPLNTGISTHK